MYDFDRRVYCKSQDRVGKVIDRHYGYVSGKRRASYLIEFGPGDDYLTGSDDLRAADMCCDGCNKDLPASSFNGGGQYRNPYDGVVEVEYCFLCARKVREEGW